MLLPLSFILLLLSMAHPVTIIVIVYIQEDWRGVGEEIVFYGEL